MLGVCELGYLLWPAAAQAQCNSSSNPSPPPPIQADYSNQSFGTTLPLTPYDVRSLGIGGCDGQAGSDGQDGNPGSPGQAGAQINSTNSGLTIIGGGFPDGGMQTIGANYGSIGGLGGTGGQGGYASNLGGQGASGGAGGNITVQFNGTFVPDAGGSLATYGLVAVSRGGSGGSGGGSASGGIWAKQAGSGGAGGAAGSIAMTASGSLQANNIGVLVQSIGGDGGAGGNASTTDKLDTTQGANGGAGGSGGGASLQWQSGTVATVDFGLAVSSQGGNGGDGGKAYWNLVTASGGNGGVGGNGGQASILLGGGSVTVNLAPVIFSVSGISVSANGGSGGNGGVTYYATDDQGGSGGNGGAGGAASATILGTVTFNGSSSPGVTSGQGVLVQSNGGAGGRGANAKAIEGSAGGGGFAGAGGSAALTLGNTGSVGTIRTSGSFAHGALVQSVGGAGGNGGQASFNTSGGAGAPGGNGGPVSVTSPNGMVVATGRSAIAVLAQSVGGGGGAGGDTVGVAIGVQIAIGGNGGLGGDGGAVQLDLTRGVFASTSTLGGAGVFAQSIGGSGGAGGSASSEGVSFLSMSIGGDAKGGGSGGTVTLNNQALVTSYGDHAAGVQVQSIGGGGGKGGSAFAFAAGVLPTGAVGVGGRGGGGGPGGNVSVTNSGQITTYGPDAAGVFIQSIGGGGGSGGAAAAHAVDFSPNKDVPAISVSVAIGGQGGAGNTGGGVQLSNAGLITTAGDGAMGVIAQSVGGGGGTGGDSTAASYSSGSQGSVSISVSAAVGGSGGTGGTGGAVTLTNSGLVATMGQDAYGVFAQSVGGGGGTGGAGDATASSGSAKFSFSTSVAVGGTGGTGGHAGTVDLLNSGAVTTRGDGADGVFAQSVGGGGGSAGGGTATAGGGNLSVSVGVGGNGGAGGDGNTATVRNTGSIVTRGTDSIGLSVQSIGGGGGKAGKGGATAGGVTPLSNAQALFNNLSQGLGLNQQVQNLGDGILQIGQIGQKIDATFNQLTGIFTQPQAGAAENGTSVKINVSVSVGGSGGAAGNGGAVNATNTGSIATYGAQSDGIYAQSVGGGGGSAGGATSSSTANDDTPVQTAVGIGGSGGAGGHGGIVTVINGPGGTIMTQGVAAFGIFAQSIGGGGGEGSLAGTVSGSLKSLSVGIGGNGGQGGDGGAVSVTTGDGTSGSTITTTGKHGIAIVAQSIGGGGGLARTMTTDQTFDPSKIIINPQGRIGDVHGLDLTIGGQNGVAGNGGPVQVTTSGPITTSGLDAHAILAQSIGGGGGLAVGGRVNLPPGGNGGNGGASGNGGTVAVTLQAGTVISTSGHGAFGVLAQSIGGGGGLAGDVSAVNQYVVGTALAVKANAGDGGTVSVTASDARITTTGNFAPAIFAQSIGGGGGLVNYNITNGSATNVQARGTAGGSGSGGPVTISLTATEVVAAGLGSTGILAQSDGTSSSPIQISIDQASIVRGGLPDSPTRQAPGQQDAAAIRLLGGTANRITNAGVIGRSDSSGIAILTDSPGGNTSVTNTGQILGEIVYNDGAGGSLDNQAGGVVSAPTRVNLSGGTFRNAGTFFVGGMGLVGQTTLNGNLVQGPTGRLVLETNHGTGASDHLLVQGRAELAGTVEVRPYLMANRAVTVVSATDGLELRPGLSAARIHLFRFDTQQTGNSLQVQPVAEFQMAAASLGTNQRRVAAHLQDIWNSGANFDAGFTALAGVRDRGAYGQALSSLSGETVGAIAAFRYRTSHRFVANMLDDCLTYEGAGRSLDQSSCGWARIFGSYASQGRSDDSSGYTTRAWTLQAGGQRRVAPGWVVGGSIAYESSEFWGNPGPSRITGDSVLVGASVRFQTGRLQISGALDFGYGSYNSRRSIMVGSFGALAKASPSAWHVGAHARFAYQIPFDGWYIQPRLDLRLSYVRGDSYTETGAGPFNLSVATKGAATFSAVPAIEIGGRIRLSDTAVLRPFVSAGVEFIGARDWAATARFSGQAAGPGFRAAIPIPGVLGRFTAGVELLSGSNWDFRLQYSSEVGSGYVSHMGFGRLAYRF
ncbi:autotransporter outer membrane beta-barrel domain-containing protein [Sabulicella rubraurantiaca]|uniref:autotransporter outer membrane beta-barrel domain-containing protein n=1 Tax=Sabulicella rubraurantiaca TaxID=2811429 RepID=UPI001A961FE6|nr:autotransporter outer membrane beta-barrel domain-containing protein [Sabulicella rubraurantiaca]